MRSPTRHAPPPNCAASTFLVVRATRPALARAQQCLFEGQRMIVTPAHRVATDPEFDAAMDKVIDENAEVLEGLAR